MCWAAALFVIALPALPSLPSTAAVAADAFRATADRCDCLVARRLVDVDARDPCRVDGLGQHPDSSGSSRRSSRSVARVRAAVAFPSQLESVLPHWRRVRRDGRRATLVLSDSVTTAAVLGWGSPMIAVAPSLVRTLDADELDRVLIHEWAHVQRRDDLVNILQIVVRIIAGWHPALWWIDRRLHIEREIACDEITVAVTGSPKSYAQCLMKLASLRGTPPADADSASGIHAVRPARTRRQDRVAALVDRAGVVCAVSPQRSSSSLCLISVGVGGLNVVEATALALPLAAHPACLTSTSGPRWRRSRRRRARTADANVRRRPTSGPASSSAQRPKVEPPAASSPARTRAEPDAPSHERRSRIRSMRRPPPQSMPAPAAGEPIPSCECAAFHSRRSRGRAGAASISLVAPRRPEASPWAGSPRTPVSRPPVSSPEFGRRVAGSF